MKSIFWITKYFKFLQNEATIECLLIAGETEFCVVKTEITIAERNKSVQKSPHSVNF